MLAKHTIIVKPISEPNRVEVGSDGHRFALTVLDIRTPLEMDRQPLVTYAPVEATMLVKRLS